MNRAIIVFIVFLGLITLASCATSRKTSTESQRRGFLMLEGEHIYKNKGFYKPKQSYKPYKKKNQKTLKKRMKASKRNYKR